MEKIIPDVIEDFKDQDLIQSVFEDTLSPFYRKPIVEGLTKPDLNKPVFKLMPEKANLIKEGKCPMCKNNIDENEFKNDSDKKEFSVSGMCPGCISKVFGK